MKMKSKAAIAAAVFAAAMNFSACDNVGSGVYGPPQEDYEDNYDPSYNQNMGVYGPPDFEEWEQEETDTETVSNDGTTQSETENSPDNSETREQEETDTPEEEQEVGEDTLKNE